MCESYRRIGSDSDKHGHLDSSLEEAFVLMITLGKHCL